ncbi:hypothetical protein CQW23_06033 [Capsicum baccatum]|uniref:Uncharacterized protein n=1 Tax=Capsicum baccatum TaxID=33114 RepID=A0A2G2X2A5_CAPBA|nr:hypothetical protein CQW23_06033 [Capsicum baccatum]
MSIAEFILISSDFMEEWEETPKCWKWKSFTKVTLPIVVRRNSSYDDLVARVMESGNIDCAPSNVVISYLMHSRKKVHPTIINNDKRVSLYMMDVDADGFRPILSIYVVERPFEGSLNSSTPPPRRPTVDDDLNDYENDGDHLINLEDDFMHMEYISSNLQDAEEDYRTGSQLRYSFPDEPISTMVKHSPIRKSY